MLQVGDRFENPRTGATLEVVRLPAADGDAFEIRRVMKPGAGKNVAHMHLDFVERYVIESGRAAVKVGGERRELGPGDEAEVPAGTSHENPSNIGADDLVVRLAFEPGTEFALRFVEEAGRLTREDRLTRQGELPLLATFAIAHATDAQSFAAGPPVGLQRRVFVPLGAALGRRRYGIPA
jgi:mannose-6-phosphate isomerase-like protein (cupin superfamily)